MYHWLVKVLRGSCFISGIFFPVKSYFSTAEITVGEQTITFLPPAETWIPATIERSQPNLDFFPNVSILILLRGMDEQVTYIVPFSRLFSFDFLLFCVVQCALREFGSMCEPYAQSAETGEKVSRNLPPAKCIYLFFSFIFPLFNLQVCPRMFHSVWRASELLFFFHTFEFSRFWKPSMTTRSMNGPSTEPFCQ